MTLEDELRADIAELDRIIDEIREIALTRGLSPKDKLKEIKDILR